MATSEQYAQLCDVVERAWQHDPDTPAELLLTSSRARRGANRILVILDLDVDSSDGPPLPTHDEILAAARELDDRLWYHRAVSVSRAGEPEAAKTARRRRRIQRQYSDLQIEGEHDLGLMEGRLAALRWVLTGLDHADT